MNGSVELFKAAQEARHQAAARLRGLRRRRPHFRDGQSRAQPPHAAGRERRAATATSSSSPRPASSRACTAASRASTWSQLAAPRRGHHRRSPAASPAASASGSSHDRPDEARAHVDDLMQAFGREQRLLRGAEERHRRPGQGERGDRPHRARARPPARRHRRRALPAHGGLPPPHGAAVRADEVDARRAEDDLRHERVLFEVATTRWRPRSPSGRRRCRHAGDRRALRRRDRARQAADPALPDAGRRGRERATCARS